METAICYGDFIPQIDSDPTYEAWKPSESTRNLIKCYWYSDPTYEAWKQVRPIANREDIIPNSDPTYEAWKLKVVTPSNQTVP